MLTTRIKK